MIDAAVIGSGPNGLVAANVLADHGWRVEVYERAAVPGGAVRSAEIIEPGFVSDLFSAFYPLAAVSPVLKALDLDRWGLRWIRTPLAFAHPLPNGQLAAVAQTRGQTAQLLGESVPSSHDRWLRFAERWDRVGPRFIAALLSPFPPVRAGARLLSGARPADLAWLARTAIMPVRRFGEEEFEGDEGTQLLLAGSALHTDLTPETAGSAIFGWLLTGLAQQVGFPVPVGGAGALTAALVARLRSRGGTVRCGAEVTQVVVERNRARGLIVDGNEVPVRHAVLATVTAPALYRSLLCDVPLPTRIDENITRWQPSAGTVKVDWALEQPIPWADDRLHLAGTVHLADGIDRLSRYACDLATSTTPTEPFVVLGQMTTTDPSRSPPGTESAWAYTHVPQEPKGEDGRPTKWTDAAVARVVDRIEAAIERKAPGFRVLVRGRYVQGPVALEQANPNLIGGDLSAGTTQLHQQLVFRPLPGLARAETPVRALYLGGASAHPGGGVHGAPGANAARAALVHARLTRLFRRAGARSQAGSSPQVRSAEPRASRTGDRRAS